MFNGDSIHSYSVCTKAPRAPEMFIEIQYVPTQFVLELQELQGFLIEIQYIPTQFVLELQEPQSFFYSFNLASSISYSGGGAPKLIQCSDWIGLGGGTWGGPRRRGSELLSCPPRLDAPGLAGLLNRSHLRRQPLLLALARCTQTDERIMIILGVSQNLAQHLP